MRCVGGQESGTENRVILQESGIENRVILDAALLQFCCCQAEISAGYAWLEGHSHDGLASVTGVEFNKFRWVGRSRHLNIVLVGQRRPQYPTKYPT